MPLGTAAEELAKKAIQKQRLQPLHDRMERHFELWRHQEFKIPKKEGQWESMTTNSSSVLGNGIADRIATARRKIYIPAVDEDKGEREDLRLTERFVNAAYHMNDDRLLMIPETVPLQAALGWHAAIRGIVVKRILLFKNEDGTLGVDIAAWDPLFTFWISGGGDNPLPWVCYDHWDSVEAIKAAYPDVKGDIVGGDNGLVLVSDVWDKDEELVIANTPLTKDQRAKRETGVVPDGTELLRNTHGIGHPPVLILPCGSAPFVQSAEHDDTIRNLGASAYINNEDLYEIRSRSLSYRLTLAGKAAATADIIEFDSTKGGLPPEIKGDTGEKGSLTPIDIGKGQKLVRGIQPQMTRDSEVLDNTIEGEINIGGMAPVAFGEGQPGQTFGGISLLTDSAQQRLAVARLAVEQSYAWGGGELVSQFKTLDIGEVTLKGLEGSNKAFEITVTKSQIDDSWRFRAKLHPDLPQNEQIVAAVATQLTQGDNPLLAVREVLERFQLSEDFDLSQELKDIEKSDQIAGIFLRRMARALIKDDPDRAIEIMEFLEEQDGQRRQEAQGGTAVQSGIPIPAPPAAGLASRTEAPGRAGLRSMLNRLRGR